MNLFKKDIINQLKEDNSLLRLKVKELEDEISSLNKKIKAYKEKEESISSAIIFAVEKSNQLEASRKKLYQLDIQRSRLLYMRLEQVLNELYSLYPELKKNPKIIDISEKFKEAVYGQNENLAIEPTQNSNIKEDPIRKLLGNVINYSEPKASKKVISRLDKQISMDTLINPVNAQSIYANTTSSSGFNLNEALHPSESLEEILKAFDLQNKSKK